MYASVSRRALSVFLRSPATVYWVGVMRVVYVFFQTVGYFGLKICEQRVPGFGVIIQ